MTPSLSWLQNRILSLLRCVLQEARLGATAAAAGLQDGQHAHDAAAEVVQGRGGRAGVCRPADAGHGASLGPPRGPAAVSGEPTLSTCLAIPVLLPVPNHTLSGSLQGHVCTVTCDRSFHELLPNPCIVTSAISMLSFWCPYRAAGWPHGARQTWEACDPVHPSCARGQTSRTGCTAGAKGGRAAPSQALRRGDRSAPAPAGARLGTALTPARPSPSCPS